MEITVVSAEVFDRLMRELSEPPKVNPALANAIRQIATGA